ncbi:hypothetical protein FBUS_04259 [Fasciolopsis buskii]|uniref:Ubiquitin-like domain-containing protein n=1 Tax=Fasciolopsis buskii TaxID=27845 RepID=A0A8E0VPE4_9TREM|nr:hypothetical protein FBUS_04259 [Fasciolopsis buski]
MYIFLMDQGQLEQLTPTPPSVSRLQGEVEEKFGLNVDNQILLVSGGFRLGPDDRLPYNGAGLNKSNPIYVFTRTTDASESRQPDILSVRGESLLDRSRFVTDL